ncbi:tail fiber assembly protein [Escherichia coli]|uniref:tail fiber assembly protein n=1 Tax=Escherichia coli TaxID=562 RepID=UPI00122E002B|nr:tail fiber assembly protein [Escherichia coli]KAA1892586.1 tail fiber assembly protein [Escherichia coli]
MAFRMSEQARTIKIYNLLAGTNEFIGEGDAYIPPHTGLPANSTDIAPPDIPAGFVAVSEKLFRIREAEETKNNLMQVASEHIAPLQDAADLEIATEEETSLLEAWKKYRVLLNRVDTSTAPDIEWPTNPVRE